MKHTFQFAWTQTTRKVFSDILMKGKEGDEVQSIEPSAATWGRVINPSTSQCQRLPKQMPQKLIVFTILDN